MPRLVVMLGWIALVSGCGGSGFASNGIVADPRLVAAALGDPPPDTDEATLLPVFDEPAHPRTCCSFGMDLRVEVASVEVPLVSIGNVVSVADLGPHAYALPMAAPEVENNGLIYTCRGGFIDTAHVRENADVQLFLTLSFAQHLRDGGTVTITGHGAPTTIVLDPLRDLLGGELLEEEPLRIASALASWVTFRIGLWHEVATWYGYQLVAGYSEQLSAFSPEDLYSNALGIRLGRAVIAADRFSTGAVYEEALAAYLDEALLQLGAQPTEPARAIMASLDGRWWDSAEALPSAHLVVRRAFPAADGHVVTPWRADDAFEPSERPAALSAVCGEGAHVIEARPLGLPDRLAGRPIWELVHVSFAPEAWAVGLPSARPGVVDERELDALIETTRRDMALEMGAGFDAPRGEIVRPPVALE